MRLDFTTELAQILRFAGETAAVIRLYRGFNPERDAAELMYLADALHHLTYLGGAMTGGAPQESNYVSEAYRQYEVNAESKAVFDLWRHDVYLGDAISAMDAIRAKVIALA